MTKKNKCRSSQIISIAMAGLVFLSTTTSSFAGHKNYYLKTTVDYGGFGLLYDVKTDNPSGKSTGTGGEESPYEEEKNGYGYGLVRHYGNIGLNNVGNGGFVTQSNEFLKVNFLAKINAKEDEEINEIIETRYGELKKSDKNAPLVFSFPGIRVDELNATSADYARANLVGETLVTGLNQAIVFINNNTNTNLTSKNSLKYLLAKLSYTSEFSDKRISSYYFEVGESEKGGVNRINVSWVTGTETQKKELIPVNGLDYRDYVKIEVVGGPNGTVYSYFPWRMEKGYRPNQALFENFDNKYQTRIKAKEDTAYDENEFLTWGQLILQAMLNYDTQGTSEQDYASDMQTIIGQGLGSDLSRTISSVRNMLGLASMSELILNMGARPTNYYLGVMTKDMHNIALTIYTLNLIIALLFVGFMIVKMLHQKMLSTTNVIAKTSLMEGIKDLAFVAVMLGFFAPLFEMLLELNYLIVRTFSYSSEYMSAFTALGNTALSMESMAGFIVSTMFLSIDMYINFVYLVREITVSFLFAIAPIMIVSYLWSPAQKNLVFGYFRELVGNIFMQSFHAITMTFFSAYNSTNMSSLQALASAYCFVPITQLFRQLVLGNSGGFSEKIGGKLAGQVSNMSIGMRNSAIKANQSKEMFTAQTKAMLATEKGKAIGNVVETGINGFGKVGNAFLSNGGEAVGSFGGVGKLFGMDKIGKTAGATIGAGVEAGFNIAGTAANSFISYQATKNAQTELGKVQSKQADETIGMGLAEMGVGLGVSSFDSAGDRMVQSGLSKFEEGAKMKGQAESRIGEGGDNLAWATGFMTASMGVSNTGRNLGRNIDNVSKAWANERNDKLEIDQKVEVFNNQTQKVDKIDALENALKHEHIIDISQGNNKGLATVHSVFNADAFRNNQYTHLASGQPGSPEAKLNEIFSALESAGSGSKELKNALNGTIIKDVYENQATGKYDFIIDAVKAGIRAEEGINMTNGVLDMDNLRIDNTGGHRGI